MGVTVGLVPILQFFSYITTRTSYFSEVRFILDQHSYLDFYSASSLKQQSADRHVAPLGHIDLIQSQPVLLSLHIWCMLSKEVARTNVIVFRLTSTHDLPYSRSTITPTMWYSSIRLWRAKNNTKLKIAIDSLYLLHTFFVTFMTIKKQCFTS